MSKPREWFRVQMQADDPSVAELFIIDFIGDWIDDYWGFGVTARAFIEQIKNLPEAVTTIRVRINSPGGDVFSATTIANVLRDQRAAKGRTIETVVDGLAASAASIILMAGDPVRIADNGLVMIHNPWSVAWGESKDFRKAADELDTIRQTIIATYQWHVSLETGEIARLMDETTWMDADEALARGFATEKVEGLKAAAALDRRALAKLTVPEKYRARLEALLLPEASPADPLAVLAACREGACPELAEALIGEKATLDQVRARIAGANAEKQAAADREATARAAAQARTEQITAACKAAGVPELADGLVAGGMTLDQVRAHLATLRPRLDRAEIDGKLSADQRTTATPQLDAAAIYAARNRRSTTKE